MIDAIPAAKKQAANLKNNFLKYWAVLYVYAGVIFYFSSIPHPLPDIAIPFFDKILHISEYAIFGFLAARAFKNSSNRLLFENFKIFAISLSIIYGVSDEFHQRFVLERQFSVFDMVADGIGGILGVCVFITLSLRGRSPEQSQKRDPSGASIRRTFRINSHL